MKTLMVLTLVAGVCWAAAPTGRFVVSAQTVRDTRTGLVWQRAEGTTGMTYADAVAFCGGLTLDGQSGWRLPRYKELMTLVDPREALFLDPTAFPATTTSNYWTSTPCVTAASCPARPGVEYQYVVRFQRLGMMGVAQKSTTAAGNIMVRCVR